jgi:cytosine/adenosine deaminase-related metal-dependent hydrolase
VHVLDSALLEMGEDRSIEELVAFPTGLKYSALRSLGSDTIVEALRELVEHMLRQGMARMFTYVELGDKGVFMLRRALEGYHIDTVFLAQPEVKDAAEYFRMLERYGGVGLDTVFDLEPDELKRLADQARRASGDVHVHVSETPELYEERDYEVAMYARPTAAVHLTFLDGEMVVEMAREGIMPIFCPRSNVYHLGKLPPLDSLVQLYNERLPAGLGTDNAAWIPYDIREELQFAYISYRNRVKRPQELGRALIYAATWGCWVKRMAGGTATRYGLEDSILIALVPGIENSNDIHVSLAKRLSQARTVLVASGKRTYYVDEVIRGLLHNG